MKNGNQEIDTVKKTLEILCSYPSNVLVAHDHTHWRHDGEGLCVSLCVRVKD